MELHSKVVLGFFNDSKTQSFVQPSRGINFQHAEEKLRFLFFRLSNDQPNHLGSDTSILMLRSYADSVNPASAILHRQHDETNFKIVTAYHARRWQIQLMPELAFLSLFIPFTTRLSNVIAHREAKYLPEERDVVGCRSAQLDFHVSVNEQLLTISPGRVCTQEFRAGREDAFLPRSNEIAIENITPRNSGVYHNVLLQTAEIIAPKAAFR
jgi:hypothetical protein